MRRFSRKVCHRGLTAPAGLPMLRCRVARPLRSYWPANGAGSSGGKRARRCLGCKPAYPARVVAGCFGRRFRNGVGEVFYSLGAYLLLRRRRNVPVIERFAGFEDERCAARASGEAGAVKGSGKLCSGKGRRRPLRMDSAQANDSSVKHKV